MKGRENKELTSQIVDQPVHSDLIIGQLIWGGLLDHSSDPEVVIVLDAAISVSMISSKLFG